MKKINIQVVLLGILLSGVLPVFGLSRAARTVPGITSRAGSAAMPRVTFPRPSSYAAQKRFFATGPENQKTTALVPVGAASTTSIPTTQTSQTNQSLTARFADWMRSWWGSSKTSGMSSVDSDQELRGDMFEFVNRKMKVFEQQVLWDRSVIKDENDLLAADMRAFIKELKNKYGSTLTAEKDGYTIAANVLLLIREYFSTAMKNTALGDRLPLAYVFTACDLLRDLRKLGVVPSSNDAMIIKNIADAMNTRLLDKLSLYDLGKDTLEYYLSQESINKIINASQLLVPISEVHALSEIWRMIYNIETNDMGLTQLNALLKKMDLTKDKTMAELFERYIFLRRLHGNREFNATYLPVFEKIISILSVTPEYGAFLKELLSRINSEDYNVRAAIERQLREMRWDAYSYENRELRIGDYGMRIAKEEIKDRKRDAEIREFYRASKNVVPVEEKE